MLKFFRRIRRKLLDRGNLKKYLLYASGEIALVVLGILIALQLNEWKTAQNNTETAHNYYRQLLDDYHKDLTYIDNTIAKVDSTIRGYQRYYEVYEDTNLMASQILPEIAKVSFTSILLSFQMTTINVLQNTGDIKLLSPEIRNRITELYWTQDRLARIAELNGISIDELFRQASLLGANRSLYRRLNQKPELRQYLNIKGNEPAIILALEAVVTRKRNNDIKLSEELKKLKMKIEEIIALIETELDTY